MYCEIVQRDKKVRGPIIYSPEILTPLLTRLGFQTPAYPTSLTAPITVYGDIKIVPAQYNKPIVPDDHLLSLPIRTYENEQVSYQFNIIPRDIEAARAALITQLGTHHERYESQRLDFYGIYIAVDLEARINVTHVYEAFKSGRYSWVRWRGSNGKLWITTLTEMEELYLAIVSYVENGFTAKEHAELAVYEADASNLYALDVNQLFDDKIAELNAAEESS